jgi:hypothetical protein
MRTAMMAITTSNSIRVNAARRRMGTLLSTNADIIRPLYA